MAQRTALAALAHITELQPNNILRITALGRSTGPIGIDFQHLRRACFADLLRSKNHYTPLRQTAQ